jgi:septal ring factor EnvC (AmiA/AmiB activator)
MNEHQEKVNIQIENLNRKIEERDRLIRKNTVKIEKLTKINQMLRNKNEKAKGSVKNLEIHLAIEELKEKEAQSREDYYLEL